MVTNAPTRALTSSLRSLTLTPTISISSKSSLRFASTSTHTSNNEAYSRARTPRLPPIAPLPSRIKPTSPSYYTGRPAYIDTLLSLEQLTRETKRLLEQSHLLPPNSSPPPVSSVGGGRANLWVSSAELQAILGTNLKAAQYRQIISRLGLLARYAGLINQYEGLQSELVERFNQTLEKYMNENAKTNNLLAEKDSDKSLWESSLKKIDPSGRVYSMGRRKESSAQVWIIPSKPNTTPTILINNSPISTYFTRTSEREAVTWPLKLTSNLSSYNIFALTRGGGKSGQAGAIAHALANAIVAQTGTGLKIEKALEMKKYVRDLLAKDGVLKRDPRMVERKKTGKLKARKAFTWVKR